MVFGVDTFFCMILCISRIAVMCFKNKEKKRKKYVCKISVYYIRIHSILSIISILMFYFLCHDSIGSYFKNCCEEKKRKKNKKVCQYNERLLHLHSQQHRINTFHSFVLFHLLSTVKRKKKKKNLGVGWDFVG